MFLIKFLIKCVAFRKREEKIRRFLLNRITNSIQLFIMLIISIFRSLMAEHFSRGCLIT